ncbi:MAG: hypothetical protein EPN56_06845 [Rhodanobacter sp.]|nr:MAG: hypothetical protein EPN78_13560 [Rhodanobacter sp.]TAM11741.1 MAG: hypothetical protein EPN66_08010 [Rhodanobacter sp.]TAM36133.1 MAG: hypothetical protein EPN56_06845 [Rhodanobacter sp.]
MTSMVDMPVPMAGHDTFDRVLAAAVGVVAVHSADAAAFVEHFRDIARHTGQAVYQWQPDIGLSSLRDAHARVPDAQRLGQALRYMLQSMHFGVYVVQQLELPMAVADLTLLRRLARTPTPHLRRVVLLNAPAALIEQLSDAIVTIDGEPESPPRLRLRNGRWLTT